LVKERIPARFGFDPKNDIQVLSPMNRSLLQGHASPEGFWYDQDQKEWVMVLEGSARIRFEDGTDAIELRPGDYLTIPAHKRHRVEWTLPDQRTVWLAIHF
jgi:cupin 2 domain-containing protein